MTELSGQQLQRRRQGAVALAVAASLLVLFGLASAANLIGSDDDPPLVSGETETPLVDAPAASDADLLADATEPTATATSSPTALSSADGPEAEAPTITVPLTPTPAPTATPAPDPTPSAPAAQATAPTPTPTTPPTPTPPPTPTATPPAEPSCVSPYELAGTRCVTYTAAYTTEATCLEAAAVLTGNVCRQAVAFLPLEDQCAGTVSGLACIRTVAKTVTQACPDGAISWPLGGDTTCGLQSPATQGAPSCPNGTAGVAAATNGGCYLPLGAPNEAGECPDNGPAVSTTIVDGECRQGVANVPGSLDCSAGAQLSGTNCFTPVAVVDASECPPGSTPNGDTCEVTTPLTSQCPSGVSVGIDGTCFLETALVPGELACVEGVLEIDVCVNTGPDPQ